jgi:hypothetical protein
MAADVPPAAEYPHIGMSAHIQANDQRQKSGLAEAVL